MNRIKIGPLGTPTQPAQSKTKTDFSFEMMEKEFDLQEQVGENFVEDRAIFVPMHYEKKYSYPLIVWLHEDGSNEHRLPDVMFGISDRNYVAVAPRGPEQGWDGGYGWSQSRQSIHQCHSAIVAAIDEACCRFNINRQRIYIAGAGAGGTMAFRIACREPELFAGVISLNGSFPAEHMPLSRLKSCRNLPVLWGHGRHSNYFSEAELCQQLRLLHMCGFPVTLRQYPCGDDMVPQAFSDANVWIMDAINGTDELNARVSE